VGEAVYDIAIVGGGINGCGIARDAAGRGLRVFLCEKGDFGSATSSASTKLIHGGLRYLEFYEFRLVREALMERERLLAIAPHIIWPMRFVLPHHAGLRPRWMLRLGLFLYDSLGGRRLLPRARSIDLDHSPYGAPLKDELHSGFEYSDCWVEDSRLVVLNAMDAAARGASMNPQTRCTSAMRDGDVWRVTVERDGIPQQITARALINAAGPWVGQVLNDQLRRIARAPVRLVKGSHIVVRKLFDHDHAYIFQNADGRIIFAIPYEQDFTLIGTTDQDFTGDPATAKASPEEVDYLCASASEYLRRPVTPEQVVWSYAGVRPLYDDGASEAAKATRDYVLDLDTGESEPPLLSVFGGKITTYRRLAEAVLDRLSDHLPSGRSWTAHAPLPGGDFPPEDAERLMARLRASYPFLSSGWARRLVRAYGTRAETILGAAKAPGDLGCDFGAGLTEAEVDYLVREEWARTADDVMWRRSKLGLHLGAEQRAALDAYMNAGRTSAPTAA
jgi:glycerol-3-phosphate dehydrogenase